MNTLEARQRMLEMARDATAIVIRLREGDAITSQDQQDMRELVREAREVVYDAGYPGDAAWRAILHANVYVTMPANEVDAQFWRDAFDDLQIAAEQLETVTGSPA